MESRKKELLQKTLELKKLQQRMDKIDKEGRDREV